MGAPDLMQQVGPIPSRAQEMAQQAALLLRIHAAAKSAAERAELYGLPVEAFASIRDWSRDGLLDMVECLGPLQC